MKWLDSRGGRASSLATSWGMATRLRRTHSALLQSYIFERRASSAGSHGDNHKEDQCDEKDHTQQPFPKPPRCQTLWRARGGSHDLDAGRKTHISRPRPPCSSFARACLRRARVTRVTRMSAPPSPPSDLFDQAQQRIVANAYYVSLAIVSILVASVLVSISRGCGSKEEGRLKMSWFRVLDVTFGLMDFGFKIGFFIDTVLWGTGPSSLIVACIVVYSLQILINSAVELRLLAAHNRCLLYTSPSPRDS